MSFINKKERLYVFCLKKLYFSKLDLKQGVKFKNVVLLRIHRKSRLTIIYNNIMFQKQVPILSVLYYNIVYKKPNQIQGYTNENISLFTLSFNTQIYLHI